MHYQTETLSQQQLKRKKTRHSLTLLCTALLLSGCQSFSGFSNSSMSNPISIRQQPQKTPKQTAKMKRTPDDKTLTEVQVDPETVEAANAWEYILENPGIDYRMNQRIKSQKMWYLKHPAFLSQVLSRSEPFLGYVIEEADKRGLPRALALLPIVESRYDPQAISRAGAVGTWQFMPATAEHFGLKMNWWYDGRRDVVTSTDAALTYLEQLNDRFEGDWLLALASYNAGGGNISKAMRRNDELGRDTDYWSLSLPLETTNYVPRLLALLEIIKNPELYNVALPNIPVESKVAIVDTLEQIDVASLARLARMSEDEFRTLNPGLRRWASDPQGPYRVMIPSNKAPQFIAALQNLPDEQKTSWKRHTVKPGDTVSQIASTYNLPTSEFKRINQLSSSYIKVGQTLLVPQVQTLAADSGRPQMTRTSMHSMSSPLQNRSIARSSSGQPVKLTPKSVNHTVAPGDTLWQISRKYNTSVKIITAENSIQNGSPLKVGQVLTISLHGNESNQRVNYKVKPGDSLYGIAKQFNVSIHELASWNALEQTHHIKPGQQITLYLSSES